MRRTIAVLVIITTFAFAALAQTDAPMELGVPGDIVLVQTSTFVAVQTDAGNLLLNAHPNFIPVIADYVRLSAPGGISVSICGQAFEPIQPTPRTARGDLIISVGDPEIAVSAAQVMVGFVTCSAFLEEVAATASPDIASLMPPVPAAELTIRSPSDRYDVPTTDILSADITFNDRSGRYDLIFEFGPTTAQWITANTTAHVGEMLELLVCGNVVNAPIIQEPVFGGSIILAGPISKAEAEVEIAQILGAVPCPQRPACFHSQSLVPPIRKGDLPWPTTLRFLPS